MNWVDWVILVVLGFSALVGIKRGFVKEALSLSTWVMAIVVAVILNERLSLYLMEYIANEKLRYLVAFVLLFVATLLLGALASSLMTQIIKVAGLKDTDRLLGMAFGLARGVVLMVALLLVFREVAPDETRRCVGRVPAGTAFASGGGVGEGASHRCRGQGWRWISMTSRSIPRTLSSS